MPIKVDEIDLNKAVREGGAYPTEVMQLVGVGSVRVIDYRQFVPVVMTGRLAEAADGDVVVWLDTATNSRPKGQKTSFAKSARLPRECAYRRNGEKYGKPVLEMHWKGEE
jgi:hypothetical protein